MFIKVIMYLVLFMLNILNLVTGNDKKESTIKSKDSIKNEWHNFGVNCLHLNVLLFSLIHSYIYPHTIVNDIDVVGNNFWLVFSFF